MVIEKHGEKASEKQEQEISASQIIGLALC